MYNRYGFNFGKFFAADDTALGGNKDLNANSILDILNEESETEEDDEIVLDDDKKKPDVKVEEDEEESKDEKDTEEEEGDELTELEEELEADKDDDELELITPVKRKEILAKYPKLFKDFPYLEKAYYREQKYSEIFPDLGEARTAKEDSAVLKDFESKILGGDISTILSVVKTDNIESYNKLVDNYLPTLQKVDPAAFQHVVNSVVKPIIYHMAKEGADSKDEDLSNAALVLNKFFFNSSKWEPHTPLTSVKNTQANVEEEKIKTERAELNKEKYESARTDLSSRVENTFKKAIEKHIDPKEDMTPYVRKTAIRDAYEVLSESLNKDTRFRSVIDKAWKKAAEQGFSKDSVENIRKIINARAQTVLPTVIKKARIEALRGMGKRVKNTADNDKEQGHSASSTNRGPLKADARQNKNGSNKQLEIPKGQSNRDFIMSD